ncbi:MAG: hypothetical protein DMG49_01280, partial [Acidobacteria bacterium]
YDWAGRTNDALNAFKRALRLFPNSPEINWRFANFAFRAHKTPEALSALQVVLAGNSPAHRDVFQLAVSATRDHRAILEMLPRQASVFFDYLNFQLEAGSVTAAEEVWLRLLELKLPFNLPQTFPYLDALIQHHGSFEHDILDGGLDWRVVPVDGAVVSMDFEDAFEGSRALRIEFNGRRNLDFGHVFQYVTVQPNTRYRFSGAMRVKGITTDSGPRFEVSDAFEMGKLFLSTENTVGTSGWSSQQFEFKTKADTRLLILRVARPSSEKLDNLIKGTVWIDRVSLAPLN